MGYHALLFRYAVVMGRQFLLKLRCTIVVISTMFVCSAAVGDKLTSRNYKKRSESMGVVLMHVNWGRSWGCGGYENAQLVSFEFEKVPLSDETDKKYSSVEVKTPSRLFVNPEYLGYGFIVEPGEYALTHTSIKAARSKNDVGYLRVGRETLVKGARYEGGTFRVDSGEIIYIGHFALDCLEGPILWRYYAEGRESFEKSRVEYFKKYEFLLGKEIQYRLFETEVFGTHYELPPE